MKNKTKLKNTGSLFNYLMGNNETIPKVGEGATKLYWSDRHAYEVLEVNEAKKTCVIDQYKPKRIDTYGMSDAQTYEYKELQGNPHTLYYKWGAWRSKSVMANFTDEAIEKYGHSQELHDAYKEAGGEYVGAFASTAIEGLTKLKVSWYKVNIIFGVKREYYDFSF